MRWRPDGGDHAAPGFAWDRFALAGNPAMHPGTSFAGSANVTADNMFNSPDGIAFTPDQRTMFVGVQHPGEELAPSHFPGGGSTKARSTIMAIRRVVGGVIGA